MLKPVRTVAPAVTPVSLVEAKAQLRVEHTDDDTLITALIEAATDHLDGYSGVLGRALVNQTWAQSFPQFPASTVFGLAVAPVQSITAIKHYDDDNIQQTLATTSYALLDDDLGPFVTLQSGESWPTTYAREDAVTVTYVAGYGPAGSDVPAALRHAILMLVGHWYENRAAVSEGSFSDVPFAAKALYGPYRRISC